jgi:acyl carrier protein
VAGEAEAVSEPAPELVRDERLQTGGNPLAKRLEEAVGSEAEQITTELVRECVMEVLRSDPDHPPSVDARLMELGMDSLMAVRLRNLMQRKLELDFELPATLIFDYPSIRLISGFVLEETLGRPSDAGAAGTVKGPHQSPSPMRTNDVENLSEEEAERLLLQRLQEVEGP